MIEEALLDTFEKVVKHYYRSPKYEPLLDINGQCSSTFHLPYVLNILLDLLKHLPSATQEQIQAKGAYIRKALSDVATFVVAQPDHRYRIIDVSLAIFQEALDKKIESKATIDGEVDLSKEVYPESSLPLTTDSEIKISQEFEQGHLDKPLVITLKYPRIATSLMEYVRIFVPLQHGDYPMLNVYHENCYEEDLEAEPQHDCSLSNFTL